MMKDTQIISNKYIFKFRSINSLPPPVLHTPSTHTYVIKLTQGKIKIIII